MGDKPMTGDGNVIGEVIAFRKIDLIWMIGIIAVALGLGAYFSADRPYVVLLTGVALCAIMGLFLIPHAALALYIMVLPLLASNVMSVYVVDVPGAKVSNILLIFAFIGFLLSLKTSLQFKGMGVAHLCYYMMLIFLIVAVLRTDHVKDFAVEFWKEPYHPAKFFLSHGLVPILASLPFFMIITSIRDKAGFIRILDYLTISVSIFSLTIISLYVFVVPRGTEFELVRETLGKSLGMHGNNLVDSIVVSFPIVLSRAFDRRNSKRWMAYVTALISLVAVAVLYSRAAYLIIIIAIVGSILLSKRLGLFVPLAGLLGSVVFLMPSIMQRILTGFGTGDVNDVTAGRTGLIWQPILSELGRRPELLAFGSGRYGIMNLQAFRNRNMLRVGHAHNMYLDTVLDTGFFGLSFFLFLFAGVLLMNWLLYLRFRKHGHDQGMLVQAGLFVSLVCFLIRGMTDSSFLPQVGNSYVLIVLALSFVMWRISAQWEENRDERKVSVHHAGSDHANAPEPAGNGIFSAEAGPPDRHKGREDSFQ